MSSLASVAPEFAAEVSSALVAEKRDDLVSQVAAAIIERCTYDASANAGYIYLVRPAPSLHFAKLAAPVAETIPFFGESGFNIDVDHDGHVFGIELLSRDDVFAKLRKANAL
jgi:uncharacterized protein YuzE